MSQDNQKFNRSKSQALHSSREYWLRKYWVRPLLSCMKKVCGISVSPDDVAFKLLLHGFQIPEHVWVCWEERRGLPARCGSSGLFYFQAVFPSWGFRNSKLILRISGNFLALQWSGLSFPLHPTRCPAWPKKISRTLTE